MAQAVTVTRTSLRLSGLPDEGSPHENYRRQARKLRHIHRRDPHRMHQALKELSQSHDQQASSWATPSEQFTELVRKIAAGQIIRYSLRQQLLSRASELGIERFQANLIIATVQHECQPAHFDPRPIPRPKWLIPLLIFSVVETLLALGAIALFT